MWSFLKAMYVTGFTVFYIFFTETKNITLLCTILLIYKIQMESERENNSDGE